MENNKKTPGGSNTNMQRITIINVKGGCGKTTIATNLASAYAKLNVKTALLDYDTQGSSMQWLKSRPRDTAKVYGVAAYRNNRACVTRSWQLCLPEKTERVIIDTPPGLKGLDLIDQLRDSDTLLVPVLPSSIDIHATTDFIRDLHMIVKICPAHTRLFIICNRVKTNTLASNMLEQFLQTLDIPVIAWLRETQNYVTAAEHGLGVHELDLRVSQKDIAAWRQIMQLLETRKKPELQPVQKQAISVCA
jgi:chromosome partitioning protein